MDYDTDEEVAVMNVEVKRLYQLPRLPTTLIELNCGYNNLSRLPELPETLRVLRCHHNRLTQLPKLPALTTLSIRANYFETIRPLPKTLVKLCCSFNRLKKLPRLYKNLKELICSNNHLTSLKLPSQLEELDCSENELQRLQIPFELKQLDCSKNRFEQLVLPDTLEQLRCSSNRLSKLTIPRFLKEMNCSYNNLSSIHLIDTLTRVVLSHNPFVSAPVIPRGIKHLDLRFTQIDKCFDFILQPEIYLYGTPLYTKMKSVLHIETHIVEPNIIKLSFDMIRAIEKRFNQTYYLIKTKSRMLDWMWRARESLAMKKYHPDELLKRLDENDFDALEQW